MSNPVKFAHAAPVNGQRQGICAGICARGRIPMLLARATRTARDLPIFHVCQHVGDARSDAAEQRPVVADGSPRKLKPSPCSPLREPWAERQTRSRRTTISTLGPLLHPVAAGLGSPAHRRAGCPPPRGVRHPCLTVRALRSLRVHVCQQLRDAPGLVRAVVSCVHFPAAMPRLRA